jgi:hypothetical protein
MKILPPQLSVSKLVGRIKGKISRKLLSENRKLAKQFWVRHLWAGDRRRQPHILFTEKLAYNQFAASGESSPSYKRLTAISTAIIAMPSAIRLP